MKLFRPPFPLLSLALAATALGGGALYAQLEGADRGVPPVESASTFEVTGIEVDATGKTAEEARLEGWKQAQSLGFKALWSKTNKRPQSEAPNLSDSVLNSMVSGIIIEQEQIGPQRYIARLGVLFDRGRSGQLLGVSGFVRRSHPLLVIPVMLTGSSLQSFESRNEWQKAWARFRTVSSPIDYIRPTGSGIDPLLLNATQTRRPGRGWWRMLIDSYGTSDVIVPEVHLKRSYPGGPAIGIFTARHGPDNDILGRFALRAGNSASIPRMMDEGVRRLDMIYTQALGSGLLTADPSLEIVEADIINRLAEQIEKRNAEASRPAPEPPVRRPPPPPPRQDATPSSATGFGIQVLTPTPESIGAAELSVSRVGGVTSALTTSPTVGGISVMRVTFMGDAAALAAALRAQGWNVQILGGNNLSISR
ncbi:MAG TPA: heavy-metal-associated domain-containing protein [Allosphingosinicella sp.]|nr:heavy-metal-associated domain-containing protein [Allosphingosinicella sp.]